MPCLYCLILNSDYGGWCSGKTHQMLPSLNFDKQPKIINSFSLGGNWVFRSVNLLIPLLYKGINIFYQHSMEMLLLCSKSCLDFLKICDLHQTLIKLLDNLLDVSI